MYWTNINMSNTYNVIFIILIFVIFTKCDDFCKADKWWEIGGLDFHPNDFCVDTDREYENYKDNLYKICVSNITEYRKIVKKELDSIDNYAFILHYFSDFRDNTKFLSCYNKTKHYILITGIENKINKILPRKNKHIFESFKVLNTILDIPFIIWRSVKAVVFSSISYLSFKSYK